MTENRGYKVSSFKDSLRDYKYKKITIADLVNEHLENSKRRANRNKENIGKEPGE